MEDQQLELVINAIAAEFTLNQLSEEHSILSGVSYLYGLKPRAALAAIRAAFCVRCLRGAPTTQTSEMVIN